MTKYPYVIWEGSTVDQPGYPFRIIHEGVGEYVLERLRDRDAMNGPIWEREATKKGTKDVLRSLALYPLVEAFAESVLRRGVK